MDIFDIVILNIIYIMFPIMIYLIYVAYIHNLNKKRKEVLFQVVIFSMLYFTMKFGFPLLKNTPLLVINIPLLIAFIYNSVFSIITTLIIVICFYSIDTPFILVLIEYLCIIIYYLINKKNLNKYKFSIFISLTIGVFMTINIFLKYFTSNNLVSILSTGWMSVIIFAILSLFIIYALEKGESIISLRMNLKELEQDKQIRMSLFKITHEIKNPIAVCKGYLDMFDIQKTSHFKKFIPIIKEEINRVLVLLQDFLSMNKIELSKEIVDINLLLDENVLSLKPLLDSNHIDYTLHLIDDEVYINGDYNRLSQVFINIIKNSIESIENDGQIIINSLLINNQIVIIITDNGSGISKNNLSKITEPFFTTKKNGTGLGVSLSKEIIISHGGSIKYESKEGLYTKVTVVLPVVS